MKNMYFGSEVKATSGQVFNGFHQVIYLSIFNALKYHAEDVDEDKTRFRARLVLDGDKKSCFSSNIMKKLKLFLPSRVLKKYLLKNYEI